MYRFGQAAAAIGVTEAALRNWMTRNNLDLWGERPEGGWRTFSTWDVMILALAAELISYGAKVQEAVLAVQKCWASLPEAPDSAGFPEFPLWLFGVRTRFGEWELVADEKLALSLADDRSVIKLAPLVICGRAILREAEARTGKPHYTNSFE